MKLLSYFLLVSLGTCPPWAAADDEALVQRGRALFQGHAAYEKGVDATSLRLPVEMSACARCHGAAGEGGREGGQPVPPLRSSALQRPRAGAPAFANDDAILRAITRGRGRTDQALGAAMPRFALQPEEGRALLAYLRRVGSARDLPPGVLNDRLRLGTVVPLSGPARAAGEGIVAGLRAGFAEANARGGVHGRHIDLQVQDVHSGVRAAIAAWRGQPVYALVGGLWSETNERADAVLAQTHVSHIATMVVREAPPPRAGWSADLLAPLAQQRAALATALQACPSRARLALAHGDVARAVVADGLRWLPAASDVAAELQRTGSGCVAYTLARAPEVQAKVPSGWSQTLVLPMPAAVLEPAAPGEKAATPWHRLGLAAARLTVELLSRAGSLLHERALLDELDRMPEWEAVPGLVVHYGRQRRHGWSPLVVPIARSGAPSAREASTAPVTSVMASRGGG